VPFIMHRTDKHSVDNNGCSARKIPHLGSCALRTQRKERCVPPAAARYVSLIRDGTSTHAPLVGWAQSSGRVRSGHARSRGRLGYAK